MRNIHSTAVIGKNVQLGDNVEIGIFNIIGNDVIIGNHGNIKPFCEIRDGCKIGDNVSFGSRCTLAANTIVDDNVNMKYGCVATDMTKLTTTTKTPCHLKKGSMFGANVTIMPDVVIGENSIIGACSQVRQNVPPNEVWFGTPAKFFKKITKTDVF